MANENLLGTVKEIGQYVAVRLAIGAFLSLGVTYGVVYFIVQTAISGLQTAVETTNDRISDLKTDLNRFEDQTNAKLDKLEENIRAAKDELLKQMRADASGVIPLPTPVIAKSLWSEIVGRDDLMLFQVALAESGYKELLEREGSYTVFAPDNEALESYPGFLESIGTNSEALKAIVARHIIRGAYDPEGLKVAISSGTHLESIDAAVVNAVITDQQIRIENVAVSPQPVSTDNGTLYKIKSVIGK